MDAGRSGGGGRGTRLLIGFRVPCVAGLSRLDLRFTLALECRLVEKSGKKWEEMASQRQFPKD